MLIYLGLGANLGDRVANLQGALDRLGKLGTIQAISPVYASAPLHVADQPEFLNLVALMRTNCTLPDLLSAVKVIEAILGRDLSPDAQRFGPRPIDIDLLFAMRDPATDGSGSAIIYQTEILDVPHPRLAERAFVLFPLRDLAPDLIHPLSGKPIHELAETASWQNIRLVGPLDMIQ
jgi:2-amino-4-hydroxy-6-hydroxymethyldihydropteridine diphosphokinase